MFLSGKKQLLVPVAIALLAIFLCFISLGTIGSDFVTSRLAEQIERSAKAKTEVKKAEIRPFSGEANLYGVKISKEEADTTFQFVADHIRAKVSVKKLIFRQLEFVSVRVERPTVVIERRRKYGPQAEEVAMVSSLLPPNLKKVVETRRKEEKHKKEFDFVIHDLFITEGTFTYRELREGMESSMGMQKLNYHATDVSIGRFYRLLVGANIEGELIAGQIKGSFKKLSAPGISSVSVSSLDMTSLNSCLVPTDVFVISSGTMNASAELTRVGEAILKVEVSGLTIAENPNSPSKTFLFIPVREIVKYVNRKGGDFTLNLTLSGDGWYASEDLDELIAGFWQELWTNILGKGISSLTDLLRKTLSR